MVKTGVTSDAASKRKLSTRRPRFLAESDVARIVEIVRHWTRAPMTWELIREAVARDFVGHSLGKTKRTAPSVWSRQALSKHRLIKKAYDDRRQELAVDKSKSPRRRVAGGGGERVVLRRQIEQLTIEVATLKERLAAYEDRFRTMLVNRALDKTTENGLSQPLAEKTDRRRVEK